MDNKKIKFYTENRFFSDLYARNPESNNDGGLWDASGKFVNGSHSIDTSSKLRQPCLDHIFPRPTNTNINTMEKPVESSIKFSNLYEKEEPIISDIDKIIDASIEANKSLACSQKHHSLDWGDYRAPPVQTTGRGFGVLEDWDKLRLGQDTRNDPLAWNPRSIETTNLAMLPLDGLKIDYISNLERYDTDLRAGMDTRFANKKSMRK